MPLSINEALAALPQPQRVIFLLHAWHGLSYDHIAFCLKLEVYQVEQSLAGALRALSTIIDS
ncbi:RNA polymerase sigma factor [Sphingobium phenoxybenzoativorans]|uniref:RNA polymerase sigma factor n=1 Tax=Sphingobium phenoxybenzoativorans TaxID=1592790 RepID=UPI0008723562